MVMGVLVVRSVEDVRLMVQVLSKRRDLFMLEDEVPGSWRQLSTIHCTSIENAFAPLDFRTFSDTAQ
jgi:hypothetical protein